MTHKTKLTIDLEIGISFDANKAEPMTFSYPGIPAGVELVSLKIDDLVLPQEVSEKIFKYYGGEVANACWEALEETKAASAVDAADARRDLLENR